MSVNRRQFLTGAAVAASASAFGLTACGGESGEPAGDGSATIAFTWWGNPLRNEMTNDAIAAYQTANPKVKITAQPGEWASYWDKLATQTAGNTAPDMIQMDMAYINEYASRGALLDLKEFVDTSKFAPGTAESGMIDDELVGVNAGVNSLTMLCNPEVLEKAGLDAPDDKSWTWDDYRELSAEVSAKAGDGITGTASAFASDNLLQIWLRQNGADLYTTDALAFTEADLVPYLDLMVRFSKEKAIPSASAITEEVGKSLDQTQFVTGKQGFALYWSNQLAAVNEAAGKTMLQLRPPTVAGDSMQRNAWYKASMLWSASARTKNPEAVGALINWWVNNEEAATIVLDERGVPANPEMVAAIEDKISEDGKTSAQFIKDIEPELGENPVAPPPGGAQIGDILTRYTTDILFGRTTVADAAPKIVEETTAAIQ